MNAVILVLLIGALVGACGYAWFRGRAPERYGAALYFLGFLCALPVQFTVGAENAIILVLLLDTAAALGFLILAFRFNSLWLGGVMVLQGLMLGIHSAHLTEAEHPKVFGMSLYASLINLISIGILMSFVLATVSSRRAMKRQAQQRAAQGDAFAADGPSSDTSPAPA